MQPSVSGRRQPALMGDGTPSCITRRASHKPPTNAVAYRVGGISGLRSALLFSEGLSMRHVLARNEKM